MYKVYNYTQLNMKNLLYKSEIIFAAKVGVLFIMILLAKAIKSESFDKKETISVVHTTNSGGVLTNF